jgi:hypothetical protein
MFRSRQRCLLPALAALVSANGCERARDLIGEQVQEELDQAQHADLDPPKPDAAADLTDAERLSAKLQLYIACLDRSHDRVERSWSRYGEDIDVDEGSPKHRDARPFIYVVDTQIIPCREAVAKGPEQPPPLPEVEAAAVAYLAASEAFAEHTQALHTYYDDAAYEDDAWTQGKATAAEFKTAYETWHAAAQTLTNLVEAEKDAADRALLVLIEEEEGTGLRWQIRNFVVHAKDFARCAAHETNPKLGCDAARREMESAHVALTDHLEQHATEADAVFWMSAFRVAVSTYWDATRQLLQPTRKGKIAQSDRAAVTGAYADLARSADNLRFDLQ